MGRRYERLLARADRRMYRDKAERKASPTPAVIDIAEHLEDARKRRVRDRGLASVDRAGPGFIRSASGVVLRSGICQALRSALRSRHFPFNGNSLVIHTSFLDARLFITMCGIHRALRAV